MSGSAKCPPDCTCGKHVSYQRPSAEERFWAKTWVIAKRLELFTHNDLDRVS